ncbi:MAG: cell division protein FtsA [Spirochaetota bacterium]
MSNTVIVGLDIGSSTICAVAGAIQPDGSIKVMAHSEQQSSGVRSGNIINIENVFKTVSSVVEDIELSTGSEIRQIVTGISGSHIEGLTSQGVVGITSKDQEIRSDDIYRSMEVARAFDLPLDREILHTLVQDFSIDGRSGIKDPVDMIGHRLETRVMIVTGSVTAGQTLEKCIGRAGYQVKRKVLGQLADAEALLSQEEKDIGTLLINMGAGMTNMIGFRQGAPVYVGGVDLGGDQVTSDLAMILNQPLQLVEQIKIEYGCCYEPLISSTEEVVIPQVGGLPAIKMPKRELAKIIEPRMAEIFALLRSKLEQQGLMHAFGGGIILTGGGAMLPGSSALAGELFELPARSADLGKRQRLPDDFTDLRYSTALGLMLYDARRSGAASPEAAAKKHKSSGSSKGIGGKIRHFFDVLF